MSTGRGPSTREGAWSRVAAAPLTGRKTRLTWIAGAFCLLALGLPTTAAAQPIGSLTQAAGIAGCISERGSGGDCVDGKSLDDPNAVAASRDNKSVYVASAASDGVAVLRRNVTTGVLSQAAGVAGCISERGSGGDCVDGKSLDDPTAVAVSADGKNVYVASAATDGVAVLTRNTTTGVLTQNAGVAGCISERGSGGDCVDGKALDDPVAIAVSVDGKSVYVASAATDGVAVLRRNTTTGALVQSPGASGCISERGSGGDCVDGKSLDDPTGLAISANGRSVYVTSSASDGVAVLARNTTNGVLSQAAGIAGCISERGSGGDCVDGKALDDPTSVAVTDDGKSVYVTSSASDGVAVLRRNTTTGVLSQAAGIAGCISERGSGGDCVDGKALDDPTAVAVSADGRSAYVTSSASDGVAVLTRNVTTGNLSQAAGVTGCISERGSGGDCVDGKALDDPVSVVVTRDGKSVYSTSAASDGVAVLRRHTA